ncbi:MAG: photosystem II protein PsbQ [Cyanobacteriota bacterium]|nr:photosystem II protein PsbQ [Cyanobacteriota bacterium]
MAVASLSPTSASGPLTRLQRLLRALTLLAVASLLSLSLVACSGAPTKAEVLSADDIALITRQAEGFLAARDRLPELASLVNKRDWTFTRNLIHGPMQEVGREMLYINQRLLKAERPEANARAKVLKDALADLDEAARLQDADALRKGYIKVASSFGRYAQILPQEVREALKQV